jgi:adenosylhomocysteine nucleosidase
VISKPSVSAPPLAILSALAQEQQGLLERLEQATVCNHAGRQFWTGQLHGLPVVLALSRIGKVAAATTAAALVEKFGVRQIVFTGVAGGVGAGVRVGDVVLARHFVQHDMNAVPLVPRFEVPLTGKTVWEAAPELSDAVALACEQALAGAHYQDRAVQLHQGLIASGDQFVSSSSAVSQLVAVLQAHGLSPLAVEMEGAAVAQVCADYGVEFAAVRTISDRADDTAHADFGHFVDEVASGYADKIAMALVRQLSAASPACRSTT